MRHTTAGVLVLVGLVLATGTHAQPLFDHLKCYEVKPDHKITAVADLQPLQALLPPESGCKISGPVLFCAPVEKTNVQPPPPGGPPGPQETDHLCYNIKCPQTTLPTLKVLDQFGTFNVELKKSELLCTPALKCPTTPGISALISTGLGGAPPGSPDPRWHLTVAPPGTPGSPVPPARPATVVSTDPAWIPATIPGTQWISADTVCSGTSGIAPCPPGDYTYELCWNQCGPLVFEGFCTGGPANGQHCSADSGCPQGTCDWLTVSADDTAVVNLVRNGVVGVLTSGVGFQTPTSIPFQDPGPGRNCLQVVVTNAAVFQQGTVTGTDLRGIISGQVEIIP